MVMEKSLSRCISAQKQNLKNSKYAFESYDVSVQDLSKIRACACSRKKPLAFEKNLDTNLYPWASKGYILGVHGRKKVKLISNWCAWFRSTLASSAFIFALDAADPMFLNHSCLIEISEFE